MSKIVKTKDGKWLLVELKTPTTELYYNSDTLKNDLSYQDIMHLNLTNFWGWKQFVLGTYFRDQLEIDAPLPVKVKSHSQAQKMISQIVEEEEEYMTESASELNDYSRKFPPKENEIIPLETTQKKLLYWFG